MLYDKARIFVQAGGGGNGCMSFRREAHVPKGGPDGGDGGHGGNVVLLCDDSYRDLQSFKRKAHYKADRGRHGEGALRHGADGEDLVVRVPPGTQVTDEDGEVHDLVVPGTRVVVARGGSGGKGNKKFAGSTRQAPRFAERGLEGQEGWLDLRLKLLADVGLVGLPNAGKSSMLARMTRAAPKVANYPFTTLRPQLGVVRHKGREFVLADIPGLIEGAADGAGVGDRFLGHVERTRLLLHLIDGSAENPVDAWRIVRGELDQYGAGLTGKTEVIALTKSDLIDDKARGKMVKALEKEAGARVFPISAPLDEGLEPLLDAIIQRLGIAAEDERLEAADEGSWSPL